MKADVTVPDGWTTALVGSAGTVVTGSTPPTRDRSNYGRRYLFASPADLGSSKYITSTGKMLSKRGFARSRRVASGSTLFVCIGSTIGKVGLAAEELATNQQINAIVPGNRIDGEYLYYAANTLSSLVRERASEQAVPLVNKTEFSAFEILLPPKGEQRLIARALSNADDMISALERMITKKQAIKHGMMQQLLTGKTRLPGFSDEWRPVRLRDTGSTYGGLSGKVKADFGVGSARFVTFIEVMNGVRLLGRDLGQVRVRPGERQNQVLKHDVLFNGSSETPEEVALAASVEFDPSSGTYLNSFCFGYRLTDQRRVNPTYLSYFFRSGDGRAAVSALAQGATRYNISKTKLLEVSPLLPPRQEQDAIVGVLGDAEAEIESLRSRLSKTRDIKKGMMQELLTGRTRLPAQEDSA